VLCYFSSRISVRFGYFRLFSRIPRISLNPFFGNAMRESHATFAKISFLSPIEAAARDVTVAVRDVTGEFQTISTLSTTSSQPRKL